MKVLRREMSSGWNEESKIENVTHDTLWTTPFATPSRKICSIRYCFQDHLIRASRGITSLGAIS